MRRILEAGPRGLVFDVASVKTPLIDLLRHHAARGLRVGSAHPMFGADVDLLSGRNLLVCRCGHDAAAREIAELFRETALTVSELDIEHHDELIAYVLGLSHALSIVFFEALRRSGHAFGALLDAASTTFLKQARTASEVARENPRLYYEIQHANAARERVFEVLAEAVETLRTATRQTDPQAFMRMIADGRDYFGSWAPGEIP
jgi:chorismate mutase/prephenate dehydrogenase